MSQADPRHKIGLARRLPLIVIAVAALFGLLALRDQLSLETIASHHEALLAYRDAHYGAAVLGFVLAYTAMVALSLPGATVASLTGGLLFGLFPGVVYNVGAASLGAVLVFLAARAGLGAETARRIAATGGAAARLQAGLRENEWSMLLIMRLAPAVPFFLANLIPAFVGVRLDRFAVTTLVGIIPGSLLLTAIGAGLGEVFARGEAPDLSVVFSAPVLGPILGLAGLLALPVLIRYLRRKHR